MGQDSAWLHLSRLTLIVGLLLASLTGCFDIEVVDHQKEPDATKTPPSPLTPDEHDLAILAVDFEPQLDYEQIVNNPDGITLLIAVENTGISTETDVLVEVQLSCDEGRTLIVEQSAEIVSIAPGETQVVRFTQIPQPPYRPTYQLSVQAMAVPGEINLVNNSSIYDINITSTSE
jgi:hypothetical protein